MLSQKSLISSPHPALQPTHSRLLALVFPCIGTYTLCKTKGLSPIDGQLGHSLLHMQLETQAQGILVNSHCCSSYRVTDPFSSLGNFSSSYAILKVPYTLPAPCSQTHPLLLPGPGSTLYWSIKSSKIKGLSSH